MTKEQDEYLVQLDEKHKSQKSFLTKVVLSLAACVVATVITFVSTVSANSANIKTIEKKQILIEKEKVDKELIVSLVQSYSFQSEILLSIKDGDIKLAEQVITKFNEFRLEQLRNIIPSEKRGEKLNKK